jgi:hypothetical protein
MGDAFREHGVRPHPHPRSIVERTIEHQWLEGFAVANDPQHLVFATLVMAITACGQHRQR